MRGRVYAKVNLGLQVQSPRDDGLHPIVSLVQSIDWADTIDLERSQEDHFEVSGADLPGREGNLAWRAAASLRDAGPPISLVLEKSIPVAAGLGGGSADAALALALTAEVLGHQPEDAVRIAPGLGADVPFCLAGGTAWVEGIGDRLTRVPTPADYWLAVVVPPFELATSAVYERWDDLGEPKGPGIDGRDLPVSLREHGPLRNDLQRSAVSLSPDLGDWISDLAGLWGHGVAMSGSGPSLFSFFASASEAEDAAGAVRGARATRAAAPIGRGWEMDPGGTLPPAPWGLV